MEAPQPSVAVTTCASGNQDGSLLQDGFGPLLYERVMNQYPEHETLAAAKFPETNDLPHGAASVSSGTRTVAGDSDGAGHSFRS